MKVILLDKEINYILAKFTVTQNLYIVYNQVVLTKYQFMKSDLIKREQLQRQIWKLGGVYQNTTYIRKRNLMLSFERMSALGF